MKKCCIVTYVFGDEYQSFIPFYIYFVNKVYPDYDVVIYLDRNLNLKYQEYLDKLGCSNYIFKLYNVGNIGLTEKALSVYNISRAIRWFLFDDYFLQYESVYVGDIDLLLCKEDLGLFEQHVLHAKFLNLPYSNSVRTYKERNSIKHLLGNIKRYGIVKTWQTAVFPIKEWKRLTGLHFMMTEECIPKLKIGYKLVVEELNKVSEGKSKFWNMCNINDESILYEVMKRSGLGTPPQLSDEFTTGVKVVENTNPQTIPFRPHHGLHLALWRGKTIDEAIAMSRPYLLYYKYFNSVYKSSSSLQALLRDGDDIACAFINSMMTYYKDRV